MDFLFNNMAAWLKQLAAMLPDRSVRPRIRSVAEAFRLMENCFYGKTEISLRAGSYW